MGSKGRVDAVVIPDIAGSPGSVASRTSTMILHSPPSHFAFLAPLAGVSVNTGSSSLDSVVL